MSIFFVQNIHSGCRYNTKISQVSTVGAPNYIKMFIENYVGWLILTNFVPYDVEKYQLSSDSSLDDHIKIIIFDMVEHNLSQCHLFTPILASYPVYDMSDSCVVYTLYILSGIVTSIKMHLDSFLNGLS